MSHFGPGVIGKKEFARQAVESTPEATYGPAVTDPDFGIPHRLPKEHVHGEAVTGIPAGQTAPADHLEELNATTAKAAIAECASVETLDSWYLAELDHPKYDGGRHGVLNAIEERKGELTAPTADVTDETVEE